MKIALCFSGQIRLDTFKKSYDNLYISIIKDHNPDIFVHSWLDDAPGGKDIVIETYNPKKCIIEEYSPKIDPGTNYNYKSMFKSIFECNQLKKQYEYENNFKYDVVIKCRFDIMVDKIHDFSIYDMSKINAKDKKLHGLDVINDIFAFANSEKMDVFSDTLNHIKTIIQTLNNNLVCGETILTSHLKRNNIDTKHLNIWFDLTRHVRS